MVPSFIAARAAAGTPYSCIQSRMIASSEAPTCAGSSPARAAEPSTVVIRTSPQRRTPNRRTLRGLRLKLAADACADMRMILSGLLFVPAGPGQVHVVGRYETLDATTM